MAWKKVDIMQQRRSFIEAAEDGYPNFSELCREYGISRDTGYKWLKRYEEHGWEGLKDRSSRPKKYREETPSEIILDIIALRNEHPSWGGRTIRKRLLTLNGKTYPAPCGRTIDRILKRAGLVSSRSRYKRKIYRAQEIIKPKRCNQVWTVDFKGWWLTKDGKRCEPLTIRDEYSKFIIGIKALRGTAQMPVKEHFIECFEKYGLPDYIRSDNGSPFVSPRALHGLTKLSAWWVKNGITPNRIPPASPQYNGGHERMHRDIKLELQSNPSKHICAEQRRFDNWRHQFNHIRPHQALNDDTPAEHYNASKRKYSDQLQEFVYPAGYEYRKISANGELNWRNKNISVTKALVGEYVGLEPIDAKVCNVWFTDYFLGAIDLTLENKIIPQGVKMT